MESFFILYYRATSNHQIIKLADVQNFLNERWFCGYTKKTSSDLNEALNMRDIDLWKDDTIDYKKFGKLIVKLYENNKDLKDNKIIEKDIEKIAEWHYVSKKAWFQEKHRKEILNLINSWWLAKQENYEKFKKDSDDGKLNNWPDKHIFVLTDEYVKKIEQKTWILTKDQRIKLEVAFLITQQVFSRKMRRDWVTPYFKHIEWALDNLLMLDKVDFEQVLITILHDNLEDADTHTYNMIKKLFDGEIDWKGKVAEWVFGLTEKRWYQRMGFLPIDKREKLKKLIAYFTWSSELLEEHEFGEIINQQRLWTSFFVDKFKTSAQKLYMWLENNDELPKTIWKDLKNWMESDKKFYEKMPENFKYDSEYKDIFVVCKAISEFRYLDKRLDDGAFKKNDELLSIKFSDRIHNLSTLRWKDKNWNTDFSRPSKRVAKLLETEYHFLEWKWKGERKLKTKNNTESRLKEQKYVISWKNINENMRNILPDFIDKDKFKITLDNVTHYDILKKQVNLIKNEDKEIKWLIKNWLYEQAKTLYNDQNKIIKKIERIRENERKNWWLSPKEKKYLEFFYEDLVSIIYELEYKYKEMDGLDLGEGEKKE